MKNPHLESDFHRLLVQYVKTGLPAAGVQERGRLWKALHSTLFEVALPSEKEEEGGGNQKPFESLVAKMEQFYAGMLAVSPSHTDWESFTIEVANSVGSHETVFYVSVPDSKKGLFEKQILSIFPEARVEEQKNDFNVFSETGPVAGAYAELSRNPAYPLKTADEFELDPINVLLNVFSNIDRDTEGAAIQFVFRPALSDYYKKWKKAIEELGKGVEAKKAIDVPNSVAAHFKDIGESLKKDLWRSVVLAGRGKEAKEKYIEKEKEKKKEAKAERPVDDVALEALKKKISSPVMEVGIRVVTSAVSKERADSILAELESAFRQFESSTGNEIRFKAEKQHMLMEFCKDFSFRFFPQDHALPLSAAEITPMMHFPEEVNASPQLRQAKAGTSPAPLGLPTLGTLLGVNSSRGTKTPVYMAKEDRLRHMYVIGQTGTGKTNLLKSMIIQDIQAGEGVCFIDPHGSDVQDILGCIPKSRYEDVIYFDPAHAEHPMGLNMLEYDRSHPEQKTFVVNEMFSIFNKLFDMKTAGGPMFEQYFRNATMLVIEDPDSGNTLLEVSRVLASKAYRDLKISRCKNPIVTQFWTEIAAKAGGESKLENIVPYITSKFDVFLSNDIMRPLIAQEKSAFNFREVMDSKKILLVNLSKGRLGDINANLIGLILVGKILMAALSRVDALGTGKPMPPFYLYIDEFQNITTDSISAILSEARKYKLSLNVAHQFIAQLDEGIRDAVFGNVGSMAVHRVGAEDAEFLEKQLAPTFNARDIMNLDNFNSYIKMLSNGKPTKPFNIQDQEAPKPDRNIIEPLKELSYLTYGRDREEIEAEIMKKYASMKAPATPAPVAPPAGMPAMPVRPAAPAAASPVAPVPPPPPAPPAAL